MTWPQVADTIAAACFLLGALLALVAAIGVLLYVVAGGLLNWMGIKTATRGGVEMQEERKPVKV